MRLFNLLKSIISTIKGISNRYYYAQGSVSGAYQATLYPCKLENLPKGIYLALGGTSASVGASQIMNASINAVENAEMLIVQHARTTMNSGGGCVCWALVEITADGGAIAVNTYKYYNSTVNYTGRLAAIKLI